MTDREAESLSWAVDYETLVRWIHARCAEMRRDLVDATIAELRAGGLGPAEAEHATAKMAAMIDGIEREGLERLRAMRATHLPPQVH
jgi:hypothetical protein